MHPCDQPVPNASNLNFAVGQTVPSLVIARLGTGGKVCVQTTATIDILADVSGYFPAGTVGYVAIDNPERIVDTRNGIGVPIGRACANSELGFQVVGKAGVPATATAVVLNVTATQASAADFTTVCACGIAVPNASNLNFRPATDVPNLVIAKIRNDGRVCTKSSADVGLIADVAGYCGLLRAWPGAEVRAGEDTYTWISDGSMLVCQANDGVYRWDSFSTPTLL